MSIDDNIDYYTKDEAYNFMASQGLLYNGLDKHYDEWFNSKYVLYFVKYDIGMYVLIEDIDEAEARKKDKV